MATQNIATRGSTAVEKESGESSAAAESRTRERDVVLIPAVDIFEDAHQITVRRRCRASRRRDSTSRPIGTA